MKWTFAIIQKMRASAALAAVFVFLLITNLLDTSNSVELKDSFTTFYKDRLVVEGYIYKLSNAINDKQDLILNPKFINDPALISKNEAINSSINELVDLYEQTLLTVEEEKYFEYLKADLEELYVFEKNINEGDRVTNAELNLQFPKLFASLDQLSEIQLKEGKNIIHNSSQLLASSNLASKLEICLLIVVGLMIQAIIFSAKSFGPKFSQNSNLN